MSTKIEWCDETINPIVGCSKISSGCANCYAEKMARRQAAMGRSQYIRVTEETGRWNGETTFIPSELKKPARWKKPRRIFIGSMGDIFHETVWRCWLDEILEMVISNPQHTFIMLTKRPQRMKEYFGLSYPGGIPSNLWLGVTTEDQEAADLRISVLLSIPATVRFLSIEPMLGAVDLSRWLNGVGHRLHWVICGGESGPVARASHPDWFRSLRDQSQAAGVPFMFKQWGKWGLNWLNYDDGQNIPETEWLDPMGKKAAGCLLDGREWKEFPA